MSKRHILFATLGLSAALFAEAVDLSSYKWAVVGDSLSDPGHPQPNNAVVKYYHYIARDTGIQVVYTNAVGGTGYKKTSGGSQCFYKRLETRPIPSDVDVVTIFGSINDWSTVTGGAVGSPTDSITSSDSLTAHMNAAIDLVKSQAPNAKLILVSGIYYGNINGTFQSHPRDALRAVAETRGIEFHDWLTADASDPLDFHNIAETPWNADSFASHYTIDWGNTVSQHQATFGHPNNLYNEVWLAPKFQEILAAALKGGEKLVKTGDKLVFMGDSITEFGKSRTHGYVNLVVKGLEANGIFPDWEGVGVQGHTAENMLNRFDRDVVAKNPDIVTISAGVNDIYKGVAYATFCQKEREMVAKAKNAGAKVVMLSPTTAGYGETDKDELRKFVGGVKEIVADEGLTYASTYEHFRAWMNDVDKPVLARMSNADLRITCDTVHMSPAGDRQMARAVLKAFGLDMNELSAAEAAWNADDTLVPLIVPPSSTATITVNLTAAEAQAVAGLSIKQILDRGIPSLAANPKHETEGDGASTAMTVTPTSCNFSYKAYDQLVAAAAKLGVRVDEAVRCAILRGVRDASTLASGAPVVKVNGVHCGATRATFDATIMSVGSTAGSCDVLLRLGTAANALGAAERIVVGEIDSFDYLKTGLQPNTTYHYELTFVNNAAMPANAVVSGTFTTLPLGAIEPSGGDDAAAIQAAIDAAAPVHGMVALSGGVFTLGAELMVTGGVTLVGQGMAETTLRQTAPHRVLSLKNGARVEGLAITGGQTTSKWTHGAGAHVTDGAISHCSIHHNSAKGNNVYGVGVYFENGSIDHSVIAYNTGTDTGAGGGIGHYNTQGTILVDTCLVYGNVRTSGRGGGVCFVMSKPNVTIRNTTIVGNSAGITGGGIADETYNHNIKLLNSIVSGNAAESVDANIAGTLASDSSNNILGGAPRFADAANNDYHLAAGSPAIGAGAAYSGIGTDLDGAMFSEPPSVGCYEFNGTNPHPVVPKPRVMLTID